MPEMEESGQPARRPSGGGGGGTMGVFKRQIGPMPMWAWMAIILGIAVAYSSFKKNKTAKSGAAAGTTTSATGAVQAADQTPPFIIQNYTDVPAPNVTTPVTLSVTEPAPQPVPAGAAAPPPPPPATPAAVPLRSGPPRVAPAAHKPIEYRVKPGDTLSGIAAKYHVPGGANALYQYQIGPSPHSAQAKAVIRQRGKNLIYSNELIYIPQ